MGTNRWKFWSNNWCHEKELKMKKLRITSYMKFVMILAIAALLFACGARSNKQSTDTVTEQVAEPTEASLLDSLLAANFNTSGATDGMMAFTELFITYLKDNDLFLHEMPLLKETGMSITSSASGKVKMYSYDDRCCMQAWINYITFIQYIDKNGDLTYKEWSERGCYNPSYEILGSFNNQGKEYCIIEAWSRVSPEDGISLKKRFRRIWVATIESSGEMKPTLRYFPLQELASGGIWKIDRVHENIYCSYETEKVSKIVNGVSYSQEVLFVEFDPLTYTFTHSEAHLHQFGDKSSMASHKSWKLINIDNAL